MLAEVGMVNYHPEKGWAENDQGDQMIWIKVAQCFEK
jgi:hypothetical protein